MEWLSVLPRMEFSGDRYSTTYGIRTDSYVLGHVKIGVRLPRGFTFNVGVNNLADTDYALFEGYPEAGRTFFTNINYRF